MKIADTKAAPGETAGTHWLIPTLDKDTVYVEG